MVDHANRHGIYGGAPPPDLTMPDFAKGTDKNAPNSRAVKESLTAETWPGPDSVRPGEHAAPASFAARDGNKAGVCECCGAVTYGNRRLCGACEGSFGE